LSWTRSATGRTAWANKRDLAQTAQGLCEERERKEAGFRDALRDGKSLVDLLDLRDRIAELGYR
jgi:hypothetical protein